MSAERKFTLNLRQNNTGKTAQIIITQQGKAFVPVYTFGTSKSSVSVNAVGETKIVMVTSRKTTENGGMVTVPFTISVSGAGASLVNAIQSKVQQSDILNIVTKPATSYEDTTATITLTQKESGKVITVTVTIAGKADDGVFRANPTTLSYSSDGGTKTSAITSTSKGKTVGWSVMDKSSVPDWITYSGESTGTLSIKTKSNN
jgi:hypothetical protein